MNRAIIHRQEFWATLYGLVIAAAFAILSFWRTDPEVYLFPRIISALMLLLALVQVISFLRWSPPGPAADETGRPRIPWRQLAGGLGISITMVLLMETLGFYTSSFLAFLAIIVLYGKRQVADPRSLAIKTGISAAFMVLIFTLFWKLLHVRTPTGWLL
ncbi:MAG: tripartite tricarboxylate transporter TctB family protein [Gammaproteobacteria bacterium]|nr:tripartite tricarboxylate transporter TctB family protein [Gammaproteobacteria bacterium]